MLRVEQIPVSAIDRADTGFKISRADDSRVSALAASMAGTGLCLPLLVVPKAQGFGLVSGFRRFDAAAMLGWETVACRVGRQTDPGDLARQAVVENAFERELGPGELVRAVCLLGRTMTFGEIADQAPGLLNVRLNPGYVGQLVRISDLPGRALELLDRGRLSLKSAKILTQLNPEDVRPLIDLLSLVKVSASKQMDIITWSREICAREGISIAQLTGSKDIQVIFPSSGGDAENRDHQDMAAMGNRLRARLFHLRFPSLDAAKKQASKTLQSLRLPAGLRLDLPENFESMVYTLQVDFTSPEEFRAGAAAVNDLIGNDRFKALLER